MVQYGFVYDPYQGDQYLLKMFGCFSAHAFCFNFRFQTKKTSDVNPSLNRQMKEHSLLGAWILSLFDLFLLSV
jgi:hypothetical protein